MTGDPQTRRDSPASMSTPLPPVSIDLRGFSDVYGPIPMPMPQGPTSGPMPIGSPYRNARSFASDSDAASVYQRPQPSPTWSPYTRAGTPQFSIPRQYGTASPNIIPRQDGAASPNVTPRQARPHRLCPSPLPVHADNQPIGAIGSLPLSHPSRSASSSPDNTRSEHSFDGYYLLQHPREMSPIYPRTSNRALSPLARPVTETAGAREESPRYPRVTSPTSNSPPSRSASSSPHDTRSEHSFHGYYLLQDPRGTSPIYPRVTSPTSNRALSPLARSVTETAGARGESPRHPRVTSPTSNRALSPMTLSEPSNSPTFNLQAHVAPTPHPQTDVLLRSNSVKTTRYDIDHATVLNVLKYEGGIGAQDSEELEQLQNTFGGSTGRESLEIGNSQSRRMCPYHPGNPWYAEHQSQPHEALSHELYMRTKPPFHTILFSEMYPCGTSAVVPLEDDEVPNPTSSTNKGKSARRFPFFSKKN